MNVVIVEIDRCIACFSCERACQFHQMEQKRSWSPNIFVNVDMDLRRIFTGTCLQCETAVCMDVCPVDALTRDPQTSAVIVEKEICLGCGLCVAACPYGYIQLDEPFRKATKCDLCGGNPTCVQVCMAEALHFENINSLAERKRKQADVRLGLRAIPVTEGDAHTEGDDQ